MLVKHQYKGTKYLKKKKKIGWKITLNKSAVFIWAIAVYVSPPFIEVRKKSKVQ